MDNTNGWMITSAIMTMVIGLVVWDARRSRRHDTLPGPRPWPLLGSALEMGQYTNPFEGLTNLASIYGPIFATRIGSLKTIVISSVQLREEVLMARGDDFDGRPDFGRFRALFGGDKDNALAFCDYSQLQERRREMLYPHTFPHAGSFNWSRLDDVMREECERMQNVLISCVNGTNNVVDLKDVLLKTSANIFNRYFCAAPSFEYDDAAFTSFIESFDYIFYQVNNGRPSDVIPWLLFLDWPLISKSRRAAGRVRHFVLSRIVVPRKEGEGDANVGDVFLDAILPVINKEHDEDEDSGIDDNEDDVDKSDKKVHLDVKRSLYALEDILGGHCAVGSMLVRVLLDLAKHPDVQQQLFEEIEQLHEDNVDVLSINSADRLHYTRAAIFETIRITSSPIVPHRAVRDSVVAGHKVAKDTTVFFNSHYFSFSESLWGSSASCYRPQRFLVQSSSSSSFVFRRPAHFRPFSLGKRSCMGFKMVENLTLSMVVVVIKHFRIKVIDNVTPNVAPAMLALPLGQFKMALEPRC